MILIHGRGRRQQFWAGGVSAFRWPLYGTGGAVVVPTPPAATFTAAARAEFVPAARATCTPKAP